MSGVSRSKARKSTKRNPYRLNKVLWCEPTVFPAWVGFCPSVEAWAKFLVEYCDSAVKEFPTTDASCTVFHRPDKAVRLMMLITVNKKFDDKSTVSLVPLVAHECMHVVQYVLEDIGEDHVGHETQAYMLQYYLQEILTAYKRTRRPRALRFGGSR